MHRDPGGLVSTSAPGNVRGWMRGHRRPQRLEPELLCLHVHAAVMGVGRSRLPVVAALGGWAVEAVEAVGAAAGLAVVSLVAAGQGRIAGSRHVGSLEMRHTASASLAMHGVGTVTCAGQVAGLRSRHIGAGGGILRRSHGAGAALGGGLVRTATHRKNAGDDGVRWDGVPATAEARAQVTVVRRLASRPTCRFNLGRSAL